MNCLSDAFKDNEDYGLLLSLEEKNANTKLRKRFFLAVNNAVPSGLTLPEGDTCETH